MLRCEKCGHWNRDGAKFCEECATPLAAHELPPEVRKTVTIVFCDVVGSTAMGEALDPESLRHVMERYFDAMRAAIERHGGTVEKFIGDAVMAVFGVPRVHEDDALRAVRAAAEMREALVSLNAALDSDHGMTLACRIGVNTGEVVAGAGDQTIVTGDAVNVAARLEQAATTGEILLGESTVLLIRDAVIAEPIDHLDLKGKTDPVPAFRLIEVTPGAAGFSRHLDAPMVGRPVPPTISALVVARLDRLPAQERRLIDIASVMGQVFYPGAVRELAASGDDEVGSGITALLRKQFVRPERSDLPATEALAFRHLLIRDAAYNAIPKATRAELHEGFADWLDRSAGSLGEQDEILAYHLEASYRMRLELGPVDQRTRDLADAAADRLLTSSGRARDRGDLAAAKSLLERCVEISDGSTLASALMSLASTLSELNDSRECAEVANRAIEVATSTDDRRIVLRARIIGAEARGMIDPTHTVEATQQDIETALAEIEVLGGTEGLIEARLTAARSAMARGNCERTIELTEGLLARPEGLSDQDRWEVAAQMMSAVEYGSRPASERRRLVGLAHAALAEGPLTEILWAADAVVVLSMEGRADETWAQIEHMDRLIDEFGETTRDVVKYGIYGEAAMRLGRVDLAERWFRQGVVELDALGETGWNATLLGQLALSLCDLGRFDEAELEIARSREIAIEDDFATQSTWRIAASLTASQRGEHERALSLADEAFEIIEGTDGLAWQAQAQAVRGRVLEAAGRGDEARAAFAEALKLFERKGDHASAERVQERLDSLPT